MAKSREKGSRRKGCVIPAASIALIIAIFVGRELYLAISATPGSAVDYSAKIAELVKAYQPDRRAGDTALDENGWDALLDVIDAYDAAAVAIAENPAGIDWDVAFKVVSDPSSHNAERDEYPLDRYVSTAEQALIALDDQGIYEHLDRLTVADRYARPLPANGTLLFLPITELKTLRSLARAVTLRLRRASDQHDDAAEVRAVVHGLALAKAVSHQHMLIDRIFGMAAGDLILRDLRAALTARPLPEKELDQIADALDRFRFPAMRLAIEGEWLVVLDTIQWSHTDSGRGDGRLITSRIQLDGILGRIPTNTTIGSTFVNLASIAYPSKKQTTEQANLLFGWMIDQLELTRQQRVGRIPSYGDMLDTLPERQVILQLTLPAFTQALWAEDQFQTTYAGTRIMVAIERFNARNGRYPYSLDDLVPDFLLSLPSDSFAPDCRFIYGKIDPEADEFSRPYTLYSVGYDQNDDNGIIRYKENILAFGAQASGIDYVFNLP